MLVRVCETQIAVRELKVTFNYVQTGGLFCAFALIWFREGIVCELKENNLALRKCHYEQISNGYCSTARHLRGCKKIFQDYCLSDYFHCSHTHTLSDLHTVVICHLNVTTFDF